MTGGPSITHVVSTSGGIGGAEQVVLALVEEGQRRGWEQTVVKIGPPEPNLGFDSRVGEVASVEVLGGSLKSLPASRSRLLRTLRSRRPDLVQATLPEAALLVGSLAKTLGCDCATVLSHQHGEHFSSSGRSMAARMDRLAGARFDLVIACSDATRDFLLTEYGYRPDRVVSIRNGWAGTPQGRRGSSSPTVVCVARLRAQKDHPTLLRAFAQACEVVPAARLRLVGDGPEEPTLRALSAKLGLDAAVDFVGPSDDVWGILAHADVFVLASRYEPLGIAALEAMAAGVPVIATAVGGLREIVEGAGLLVQAGDVEGLARGIVELLTDAEGSRVLAERGRKRAAKSTIERMVAGYFGEYEALIEQSKSERSGGG